VDRERDAEVTVLELYRDDGPLAAWLWAKAAPAVTGQGSQRPFAWLVPPGVRAFEYGSLVALTALADPDALPICFAFLAALAFHHYDVVYRLGHQGVPPPAWLRALGGGWEGRLIVACLLALGGVLSLGLLAAAIFLGSVYMVESLASWVRFARAGEPARRGESD
jgi:hypothetical protein